MGRKNKKMHVTRTLPVFAIVLVAGLTLASGAIQGWMSNRWGTPADMLAAATRLEGVPTQFGDWQFRSSDELTDPVRQELECTGYILHDYANQETGETVKVSVLLGPSGPMSIHMPEICYSGVDYTPLGDPQRTVVAVPEHKDQEFWCQKFRSNHLRGEKLSVWYAWSTGGDWSAPENPRFSYADQPYLYKIQLAAPVAPEAGDDSSDTCQDFLREFIPKVKHCLSKPSAN